MPNVPYFCFLVVGHDIRTYAIWGNLGTHYDAPVLTQTQYVEYLLGTPKNYTYTHLPAHLPNTNYDQVNRFLRTSKFPLLQLRELVQPLPHDSPEAFRLVDDNVQNKRYKRFIALTKRP